jgi:hypothetical protein
MIAPTDLGCKRAITGAPGFIRNRQSLPQEQQAVTGSLAES